VTYEVTKGGARDSGPKDMHVTHNDVPNDWGGEGEDMWGDIRGDFPILRTSVRTWVVRLLSPPSRALCGCCRVRCTGRSFVRVGPSRRPRIDPRALAAALLLLQLLPCCRCCLLWVVAAATQLRALTVVTLFVFFSARTRHTRVVGPSVVPRTTASRKIQLRRLNTVAATFSRLSSGTTVVVQTRVQRNRDTERRAWSSSFGAVLRFCRLLLCAGKSAAACFGMPEEWWSENLAGTTGIVKNVELLLSGGDIITWEQRERECFGETKLNPNSSSSRSWEQSAKLGDYEKRGGLGREGRE
jgi:hypothetical protein